MNLKHIEEGKKRGIKMGKERKERSVRDRVRKTLSKEFLLVIDSIGSP